MNHKLIIITCLISFLLIFLIFKLIKSNRMIIKYGLVWIIPLLFIIFCSLIPDFMNCISKFLGFEQASNMLIVILIAFLFVISLSLMVIVSGLREKNKMLIQELSLLKSNGKNK